MIHGPFRDPEHRRSVLQLMRLERLTDVVYAIVIWRIFAAIPKPGDAGWSWNSAGEFLAANVGPLVLSALAVLIVIIYWSQNSTLFGNLERTDGKHSALSIFQLLFLFLFLFAIQMGVDLPASPANRAFESLAAALLGLLASGGWIYAVRRGLTQPDLERADADAISDRTLAEPITALITIPFAWVGPWMWEAAWLLYPVIAKILTRRRARRRAASA